MKEPVRRSRRQKPTAIVVGTDFSSASADAMARATEIARETGATLHVVHASRRIPAVIARTAGLDDESAVARTLAGFAAEIRAAGARVRTHHVRGGAMSALRTTGREVGASLVVVGARGRTVPDATIGSTAERIAAAGGAPVLLVRRKVREPYRDVVIAADAETDLGASANAARLVAPDARLSVLHAYATPFEPRLQLQGVGAATIQSYRRQVRREADEAITPLVEKAGLDASSLVLRHGDARRVLLGVDKHALLVIHRSRSVVRHALVGSVSRWLIAYGTSDILLV